MQILHDSTYVRYVEHSNSWSCQGLRSGELFNEYRDSVGEDEKVLEKRQW